MKCYSSPLFPYPPITSPLLLPSLPIPSHHFTIAPPSPLQVIRHELHITNQIMHLEPPVETARCDLIAQLHNWISIVTGLPRIQSSRYQVCAYENVCIHVSNVILSCVCVRLVLWR